MSHNENTKVINVFSQFGKNIVIILFVTFLIHSAVKLIGLAILGKNIFSYLDDNLLRHIFSIQMIPNLVAYAFLISAVYYLYNKTKRIMMRLNANEIEVEKEKAVMKTLQRISGLMGEYISVYNSDIKRWIEERHDKGQQPPRKIVDASNRISMALKALSRVSFIMPYVNADKKNLDIYADYFENYLRGITTQSVPAFQLSEMGTMVENL